MQENKAQKRIGKVRNNTLNDNAAINIKALGTLHGKIAQLV